MAEFRPGFPRFPRSLGRPPLCTYYGAEFTSKKTLISAQNPENKGPAFFLPPRSMVLKVVTAKSWKHGSYRDDRCLPGFRLETAITLARGIYLSMIGGPPASSAETNCSGCQIVVVRLSRIEDYLVDNIYTPMLSRVINGIQQESDQAAELIPKLGHAWAT